MGMQSGRENTAVSTRLLREPWRFGFYQGTRLLEWVAARTRQPAVGPPRFESNEVSVGTDVPPGREAVRFRASASARFPSDEVLAIHDGSPLGGIGDLAGEPREELSTSSSTRANQDAQEPAPFQMVVGFLGLTGPCGALPSYFHRLVRLRLRAKDRVLQEFFDLFNHRAISLFYRAWVKYRFPIAYERTHRFLYEERPARKPALPTPSIPGDSAFPAAVASMEISPATASDIALATAPARAYQDDFSRSLFALIGLGTAGQRDRSCDIESAMLNFAGLFAHLPRSAISLERILREHFQLPIQLLQFQGQWLTIAPADRSRLGSSTTYHSSNNSLGTNTLLGDGVWDVQSRFRLRIGPLDGPSEFYRFLPVAREHRLKRIQQLTRAYVGPELEFDIQLVLRAKSSLRVELEATHERAPLLGWNVWLRTTPFDLENDDAVFPDEIILET
jgi:type VI secretion system protein ImpH